VLYRPFKGTYSYKVLGANALTTFKNKTNISKLTKLNFLLRKEHFTELRDYNYRFIKKASSISHLALRGLLNKYKYVKLAHSRHKPRRRSYRRKSIFYTKYYNRNVQLEKKVGVHP
jgi:hypothetical protein